MIGELLVGFLSGARCVRDEEELADFLGHPVVEEVPVDREVARIYVDREVARIYAEIVTSLRRGGTPLPTNDIWIAATSARAGSPLLSFDDHFRAVGRVGTIVLQAPSG